MLKKLLNRFKEKPLFTAFLTLSSGALIGQIIGLLTTPIVSRIYDNESFGEYNIFVSTAMIICTFSQLGLASAIMIPDEEESSKKIVTSAFILQLFLSSLFLVIAFSIAPIYKFITIDFSYSILLLLIFVYIIAINTNSFLNIYINRKMHYRILFWNSIIGAFSTLLITIPLGLLKFGFLGFIISSLVSIIICNIQMLLKENPFVKISFKDFRFVIKRYRDFITFQFSSNLLTTFSTQYPNQTFDRVFGSAKLGSYSMTEKIFGIPSRLIAVPIMTGIKEFTAETIATYDLVIVTAAHTNVDYSLVQQSAKFIFDTKNVMKQIECRTNIEVL